MSKPTTWGTPYLDQNEVRQGFIDFFTKRDHQFIRSAPVVPHDDPTLLFTNAGMNQFKSIFLGDNQKGLKRAVNSQKCLRVSGKHNDLDEVGRDTYHHTLFEMLGNWSFGDYYKKEAIEWAWELLTDVWKLPPDRLFVTVFKTDDEAFELWKKHLDEKRIMRFDEKDNFWEMGDVGPCGPCSEIHFDRGDMKTQDATYKDKIAGVNGENDRYIEIWNLVFMQSERLQSGDLKPLKSTHVDTGMGFERICSIIQGHNSNYDTDIFTPIISKISELTRCAYERDAKGTPHRVIADHLRALSFSIADGATPGNEGRGYVLRRILRRASRFSKELNQTKPFIYQLIPTLAQHMGDAFPELRERQDYIMQVVEAEEKRFMQTLDQGLQRLQKVVAGVEKQKADIISGEDVFVLYDTYGFPADLTRVMAEERGLKIDEPGFEAAMKEQRERARSAAKFDSTLTADENWTILRPETHSVFTGYESLSGAADVLRYCERGDSTFVVLNETPFYAESGGQVGDVGRLTGEGVELIVVDTIKVLEMTVHRCSLASGLVNKETMKHLNCKVDGVARADTMRNHSATHLMHAALREVLGEHVQQQGSRVAPEGLRFDFTHHSGVSPDQLRQVEDLVNVQILSNLPVVAKVQDLDGAKAEGALALFGEKYGDEVRTIKMGGYSFELCGGTHVSRTGDIGSFKVTSESSIAAGIRRIEAITGLGSIRYMRQQAETLGLLSQSLKSRPELLPEKISELSQKTKDLEKQVKMLWQKQLGHQISTLIDHQAKKVGSRTVLITSLKAEDYPKDTIQLLLDGLAAKLGNGVAVLTRVEDDNLAILAAVGTEARGDVKAGDLVKSLSTIADGRGGGRPDKAQAGSKHPEKEPDVLAEAKKILGV